MGRKLSLFDAPEMGLGSTVMSARLITRWPDKFVTLTQERSSTHRDIADYIRMGSIEHPNASEHFRKDNHRQNGHQNAQIAALSASGSRQLGFEGQWF